MAERKNRTFKDMINSLLLTSGLPKYLWEEALNTACHILNRVPLKHNTSTPFELWKGRKPSLKYFRVWGCLAKVLVPEHKRKKLGPKTVNVVFLGYVETSYALRFLVIKSEIPGIEVNTIVEFRDAVFLENVFPLKTGIPSNVSLDDSLASTSIPEHVEKMSNVAVSSSSSNHTHKESDEPRRSKRARVVKDFGSEFVTYNIEDDQITFKDAMASSEAKHWKEAVKSEMDFIVSNGTWVLVDLPPRCTTIGCKWIFKRKLKPDGTIDKFKARLVAKGFKQKEGIDYFDTYSSVARLTTIQVLIALASVYNLPIHQIDVKTAFLYGELEEKIYMDQPKGFVAHGNEHKVCKLVKSLYGLKQAPKQWHEKFDKTILAFGFTVNENDKCIYCKVKGDKMIILCLYMDDILLIGSCLDIITETKSFLKNKFEMKDMGEANVILGIKLTRSTDGIVISQAHYVEKIIQKFGYQNSRIAKTPYDPSVGLFKNESGVSVVQLRYSKIIGSLQYLANSTRPDISFSVSKLARYTSCPDKTHWGALDRVLRYLKGSVSLAIHYGIFPVVLEGYSDASWIAKNSGSNGCSGYVFTLGGGAVSWKSAKQTLITRSTFEAELCALDTTGTEAEWLFGLLSQLPIVSQPLSPIAVHCDSQTTIAKVRSRKYNQKTKRHIQVRLKSIRALVSDRVMGIDFVGTKDNVVDPLTKGLNLSQVHKSRLGMGLKTHQ
ncbi:UNVERIFIED_CONTAM: Retrovirus-related Pol polyprotein from transposon TNT 1-94 [Sesamum indicum]